VAFKNNGWYADRIETTTPVDEDYRVTKNMDCYIHWIRYASYTCVDDDSDNPSTESSHKILNG